MQEIKRVLEPTGNLWLNMGDSYASSGKIGGDFTFAGNISKEYQGRARTNDFQKKSLLGQPWRLAIKMIDEGGWILRNDIVWAKQIYLHSERRTKGSVMPTSVKDRFNNSYEHLFHFVKNKKYFFNLDAVRLPIQTLENRASGIDREKEYPGAKRNKFAFNYGVRDAVKKSGQPQFRASEEEIRNYQSVKDKNTDPRGNEAGGPGSWVGALHKIRVSTEYTRKRDLMDNQNLNRMHSAPEPNEPNAFNEAGKNLPNVWLIGVEPSKELHFARFPTALCEIPIQSSCPENGIVLDPFAGSCTTAEVAKRLKRRWIMIELNSAYIEIGETRLNKIPEPMF